MHDFSIFGDCLWISWIQWMTLKMNAVLIAACQSWYTFQIWSVGHKNQAYFKTWTLIQFLAGFFYTRPLFKGYQKNELKVFTDSLRYSIGGTGTGRIYLPSSFQKVSVRSPSNLPKCHQLARANKKFLFMCRCHLKTWCAPHFSWHLRDSTFRKVLARHQFKIELHDPS